MAAVLGLDDELVEAACERSDHDVFVANFNAPGQVIIAGTAEGVADTSQIAASLGSKRVLPVKAGGAFHTPLMASAGERLHKALHEVDFAEPNQPIVANVDAKVHSGQSDLRELLERQLTSPVRWKQSLNAIEAAGVSTLIELGPGRVLCGMAKRSCRAVSTASVAKPDDLDRLGEELARSGTESPSGDRLGSTR